MDLSLAAASKLIGERLSAEADKKIVMDYLADSGVVPLMHEAVARNYAEALFALGEEQGESVRYGDLLGGLAWAVAATPNAQGVLMSPRVTKAAKAKLLADTLPDAPKPFVAFLQALVKRNRQGILDRDLHGRTTAWWMPSSTGCASW